LKILLIGSGGREHALAWKLAQSRLCDELYLAPGNPGMANLGTLVPLKARDLEGLKTFALKQAIGLTVVGPEEPLVLGLADALRAEGLEVFGPPAKAAALEGSKDFCKRFLLEHQVPTARAETFDDFARALAYARLRPLPLVLKADGLAAGKGVVVADSYEAVEAALKSMLVDHAFGTASARVLVEDFLDGEEASLLCFCDGASLVPMAGAQDHKRIGDNDSGPNTGGMGAYSPAPVLDAAMLERVQVEVLAPTLAGLKKEGLDYRGCLYVGLMIGKSGPKVVEFNCRFGDPETQAVVPRMDFDLGEVMLACAEGRMGGQELAWKKESAACVVLASAGYPVKAETGKAIHGLEEASADGALVFHAGTESLGNHLVTAGGRVLGVTGLGKGLRQALDQAYDAVASIRFEGMQYRKDIGARALKRTG
jgi:phosphoribosylamine--glycine ligase